MTAHDGVAVPPGRYEMYADDDDVIGLTVAKTYPQGWPLVRVEPPFMDGFDEFSVGQFLAWCLTNAEAIAAEFGSNTPPEVTP